MFSYPKLIKDASFPPKGLSDRLSSTNRTVSSTEPEVSTLPSATDPPRVFKVLRASGHYFDSPSSRRFLSLRSEYLPKGPSLDSDYYAIYRDIFKIIIQANMFTFVYGSVAEKLWKHPWFVDVFQCISTTIINKPYLLILIFVPILVMYFSFSTYNRVVDMTDIGYDDEKTNAKKLRRKRVQLLKETNRLRCSKDLPPVYPNGWIPLLESRDVPVGKCKPVTALGQQFVVFRGKTRKCFVLDAFCPHLGAHLGIDGKVHEDCIECPFHGWRFAGRDGSCVKIPYVEKIPEVSRIKSWETIEQNGFIYVWHHAEDEPALWKPPLIPEIENRLLLYRGRAEHIVNSHVQEIMENIADFEHINCLHKFGITSRITLHPENWWRFFQWITELSCTSEETSCYGKYKGIAIFKLFGISVMQLSFEVQQIGPAILHVYYKNLLGNRIILYNITPEGPFRQRSIRHYYSDARFTTIFDFVFPLLECCMFERDTRIWNYKMFVKNPVYVSQDRTIDKCRKWYSQFYSENSPRIEDHLNW
ncbi:cholesterol 7-desaturase nvd-like [Centruroides vittatus]|uniref:cholesterol 7-desaturase nvd-like n=1 Tax=Centruroides vittatus TaxID=120091 RepID=UPI00350FC2AF